MAEAGDWKLPWEGGCRCGRLRVRITAPPMMASVCHCRGCQRMSASAFSTSLSFSPDAFEVISGEPVIGGLRGDAARHHHCEVCKSWVYTIGGAGDEIVNLRGTMLDDASWFEPFIEMQTAERLPWVRTPAKHSFDRFPDLADFPRLIEDYTANARRP